MKHIYDPTFRYVKSVETDLRKTFARVRKEMREQAERDAKERDSKVRDIRNATIRG